MKTSNFLPFSTSPVKVAVEQGPVQPDEGFRAFRSLPLTEPQTEGGLWAQPRECRVELGMGVCHLQPQPLRSEGRRVGFRVTSDYTCVRGHPGLRETLKQTSRCQDATLWYPVSQLAFGSCLLFYTLDDT